MFFDERQKRFFSADAGAFSPVTADEARTRQLTLDRTEKNVLFRVNPPDELVRGDLANKESGRRQFKVEPDGQLTSLAINLPKSHGNEVRLYFSSSFSPKADEYWYIFLRDGVLHIGSMSEAAWRSEFSQREYNPPKHFEQVCAFCEFYDTRSEDDVRGSELHYDGEEHLVLLSEWLHDSIPTNERHFFSIEAGMGTGRITRVPYICALTAGQKVSNGQYVAMCFGRHGDGAVFGFASSTGDVATTLPVKRDKSSPGFIDVDGDKPHTKFNDTFFNPLEIARSRFNEKMVLKHLDESVRRSTDFHGIKRFEQFGAEAAAAFDGELHKSGFRVASGLSRGFICALLAKPFVILTGNSGTGKTKLAELFARWLSGTTIDRFEIVPVGADWTDNRNVLGFVNYLRPEEVTVDGNKSIRPIYQSTRVLDLLITAEADRRHPYFLILDEMNLSHVERYFADFLSAMELNDGKLPLHNEGDNVKLTRKPGGLCDVPERLILPSNVFVVGTVNVDETTYMFSPKVLDRANVIEFRVDKLDVTGFLPTGGVPLMNLAAAPTGYAEGFLQLSDRARGLNEAAPLGLIADSANTSENVEEDLESCRQTIEDIFSLMLRSHREFAFRTISEILRFLAVDYELTPTTEDWNWRAAMDSQIMQKILPKLHGSRRQIETLLIRLARYCERSEVPGDDNTPAHLQQDRFKPIDDASFERSYRKLCEMIDAVRRDQFVSFIQ